MSKLSDKPLNSLINNKLLSVITFPLIGSFMNKFIKVESSLMKLNIFTLKQAEAIVTLKEEENRSKGKR
jgi:hypothetical protein